MLFRSTDFQANHNVHCATNTFGQVVLDTTKVQIFKQITTIQPKKKGEECCFRYHKGTDFQANHNAQAVEVPRFTVVLDTTKVQIFKQITTLMVVFILSLKLF